MNEYMTQGDTGRHLIRFSFIGMVALLIVSSFTKPSYLSRQRNSRDFSVLTTT